MTNILRIPVFLMACAIAAPTSRPLDRFGLAMLYPSTGTREWVSKWDNGHPRLLASGERDPDDAELIIRGNGEFQIDGKGVGIMRGDAPRVYVYDEPRKKKWLNVEVTFYCMRVGETAARLTYQGFGCGTRSDHQDASDVAEGVKGPCQGPTYYGKLIYDGRVVFQKEIIHHHAAGYSENRPDEGERSKGYWDTPDQSIPRNVWIGFKLVVRNLPDGQRVKLELYRDLTDGQGGGKWEKLIELIDGGGWTNPLLTKEILQRTCAGGAAKVDEVLLAPRTSTFIRNDGLTDARLKCFSVREIDPLAVVDIPVFKRTGKTEASVSAGVLCADDFEAGSPGARPVGWVVSDRGSAASGDLVRLVDASVLAPVSGRLCVEFQDNTPASQPSNPKMVRLFSGPAAEGTATFQVYLPAEGGGPFAIELQGPQTALAKMDLNTSQVKAGIWHEVRLQWFRDRTWTWSIGGESRSPRTPYLLAEDVPTRLHFRCGGASLSGCKAYLDDVRVVVP